MIEQHNNPNKETVLERGEGGAANFIVVGRKTYAKPVLVVHGQFERMTLQASGTGNSQTGDDGNTLT